MNKKHLIGFAVVLVMMVSALTVRANNREIEPNNTEEKATHVTTGVVQAQANDTKDWFKISIPQAGPVTLIVEGLPSAMPVQVGVKDIAPTGWKDGKGRVEYRFNAEKTMGFIWVGFKFHESVCGYDWCAARFVAGGPLYGVRPSAGMPADYNGESIRRDIPTYRLVIRTAGAPAPVRPVAASQKEIEPNNTEDKATAVNAGVVLANANDDKDWFKVSIPRTGEVRLIVEGLPSAMPVQVGVKDIAPTGWKEGKGRVEYRFKAEKTMGFIWVGFKFHESACGYDWCAARFVKGGPLYAIRPSASMPAQYNGDPILRNVPTYRLIIKTSGHSKLRKHKDRPRHNKE